MIDTLKKVEVNFILMISTVDCIRWSILAGFLQQTRGTKAHPAVAVLADQQSLKGEI